MNDPTVVTKGVYARYDFRTFKEFIGGVLQPYQYETADARKHLAAEHLPNHSSGFMWRGQRDAGWGLVAAAHRLGNNPIDATRFEEMDLKNFIRSCIDLGLQIPDEKMVETVDGFHAGMIVFNQDRLSERSKVVALAQHYGVPTTFLDWSQSSTIALGHAVWSAIAFMATDMGASQRGKVPTTCDEVSRIALWNLDPDSRWTGMRVVENADPHNTRQRQQRGMYTQHVPMTEDEIAKLSDAPPDNGDLVELAKVHPTSPYRLRCFTFPGSELLLAYEWLRTQDVTHGNAYGGYEGAGKQVNTNRDLRVISKSRRHLTS